MSEHTTGGDALVAAASLAVGALRSVFLRGQGAFGKKTIVVTYSILGSVVKDLVGDAFEVIVSIPDGLDPHEWEPSAKDIEAIDKAALVVENGLGLEEGMAKALDQARKAGVKFFTASDHVIVRTVGAGEGIPSGDPDQAIGAEDPHLWTDPVTMQAVVDALTEEIMADFRVDLSKRRADLDARLDALDAEVVGLGRQAAGGEAQARHRATSPWAISPNATASSSWAPSSRASPARPSPRPPTSSRSRGSSPPTGCPSSSPSSARTPRSPQALARGGQGQAPSP